MYFYNLEPSCIIKTFGKPAVNKALKNHVIGTPRATSAELCELHCFMKITCQSYNFGPKEDGGYVCELNDSDAIRDPLDWTTKQGFIYGGTKVCCIWLRLFVDYKWSSACDFTKYTAVPRLSRLVNKSVLKVKTLLD